MGETKTFEQYMLSCGIKFPKDLIQSDDIINDPEKLARVGDMVKTYREELRLIIEARIAPLREEMLMNCTPYELLELRRCVMEIASIMNDIDSYTKYRDAQISRDQEIREAEAQGQSNNGYDTNMDNSQSPATL